MFKYIEKTYLSFLVTMVALVTVIGVGKVLIEQVLAIAPPNNIQLQDQSGPGNQQNGYTNQGTIAVQFDHDNTSDAFFIDENPGDPACGAMIPLTAPNTATTQNVPAHNLSGGDGAKQVFVHLVDDGGDGCGGAADQFSSAQAQIIVDTGIPTAPVITDFTYDANLDSGSLANAIVDAGSGLDFQIITSGTACNALPALWNSAVDAGTGFGADTAGIAVNPTLVSGAGANAGEIICIRVRDKAGNVTAWTDDGTVPAASGGGSRRRLMMNDAGQVSEGQDQGIAMAQSDTSSASESATAEEATEYEKLVESVRLMIPEDVFGHQYEYFILDLYLKGILDSLKLSFNPDTFLNRAEMLKIVMTAFPGKESVQKSPFKDVKGTEWYASHFINASERGIIKGFLDGTARPDEKVTRVEALAMLSRAKGTNLDYYRNQPLHYDDVQGNGWYMPVLRWAVFEGIVSTTSSGFKPSEPITRGEMAQMTSRVTALGGDEEDEPCNCDKEKADWEAADAAAKAAQAAADTAGAAADAAAAAASNADKAAKDAQDKVNDLNKFFDDTSSASSGGETVTTGDLELLREANRGVYDAWKAGTISAQEASDAWGKIDKAKLTELRAKKAAELEQAKKDAADAKAKADAAKKAAADGAAKAAAAQKKADAAKAAADAAKAAYDECLKKCALMKAELAATRAQQEADRAAAAAAADAKRRQQAEDERRAAETKAQQDAAKAAGAGGGGGGGGDTSAVSGGGGTAETVGEGPCKPKFTAAVKARAAQIEARGGSTPKLPGETVVNVANTILDALGSAAGAVAEGGSNAAAGLAAGSSLIFAAYGVWVDYVGSAIQGAGERIIVNRRICEYVSNTTDDGCGHVTFSGQTVYYERGADGKLHVLVMGPGDKVVPGECE